MTFSNTVKGNIESVIGSCASKGMPVYWTDYKRDPRAPGSISEYYAGLGSDAVYGIDESETQIVDSLRPHRFGFTKKNVFRTCQLSSFSNGELAKRLIAHDMVILIGGWTDHCITATAHDAFSRDISVCVVRDACFTLKKSHKGFHEEAIKVLGHTIAKISRTREIARWALDGSVDA